LRGKISKEYVEELYRLYCIQKYWELESKKKKLVEDVKKLEKKNCICTFQQCGKMVSSSVPIHRFAPASKRLNGSNRATSCFLLLH
jgi:hypothetical protein